MARQTMFNKRIDTFNNCHAISTDKSLKLYTETPDDFYSINNDFSPLSKIPDNPKTIHGKTLFCGGIIGHFGHMIVECLHRLWAIRETEYDNLLFTGRTKGNRRWNLIAIDAVGHMGGDPNKIIIVDYEDQLLLESLMVPERGATLKKIYPDNYNALLPKQQKPKQGTKVFITRRFLRNLGCLIGESYFAMELKKLGFIDFIPETHSFSEQIQTYLNAKQIIAIEGSSLHTFDLIGEMAHCEIGIMNRRGWIEPRQLRKKFSKFSMIRSQIICSHAERRRSLGYIEPESAVKWLKEEFDINIKLDMAAFRDHEGATAINYVMKNIAYGQITPENIAAIRQKITRKDQKRTLKWLEDKLSKMIDYNA